MRVGHIGNEPQGLAQFGDAFLKVAFPRQSCAQIGMGCPAITFEAHCLAELLECALHIASLVQCHRKRLLGKRILRILPHGFARPVFGRPRRGRVPANTDEPQAQDGDVCRRNQAT